MTRDRCTRLAVARALRRARREHLARRCCGTGCVYALLRFAHELAVARQRQPDPFRPGPVQRVVGKWFGRGLSGRLMALVGEELARAETEV